MRPDAQIVLAFLACAILATLLSILVYARNNGGVALVPSALTSFLFFGFSGGAITPGLIIVSRDHGNLPALIAHERCHQQQMLRDGYWTWLWRYVFDLGWRQMYEVQAYRIWVQHSPDDLARCARALVNEYGLGVSIDEAIWLLTETKNATR